MPYKVFLVEDEITTREGIRDNVAWREAGFELCGEAPDGEIALPQIEATQPDVLITDIKMPFMDGLQLCRILREHMPWMKIIIISGYNEFQYAQTAIQLGVSEYLLKPVSVQDLQAVLSRVAAALDREKSERAYLKQLRSQVEDNIALLREKFLLRLVTGGESSIAAIEQSQQLGLNIIAPYYQVILFEAAPRDGAQPLDYDTCQQVERLIAGAIAANMDALLTRKGMEAYVLILKGERLDQINQEGAFLIDLIREEVEKHALCRIHAAAGSPQQRLGDLHRSFAEALAKVRAAREEDDPGDLESLDHAGLRAFFETARPGQIEGFYDSAIRPLVEAALRSSLLKRYVIVDILLTAAQFISDLGGDPAQVIPALGNEETFVAGLHTGEQIRAEIEKVFAAALAFRDEQARNDRAAIVQQARAYIDAHFTDPGLSLNEVAAQVNFSPNHFSAVFREATGVTFRDYLTRARLEQAKKLLRSTRLKIAEVAYQCGYNDPHYFSIIFRKNIRATPQQYRAASRRHGNNG